MSFFYIFFTSICSNLISIYCSFLLLIIIPIFTINSGINVEIMPYIVFENGFSKLKLGKIIRFEISIKTHKITTIIF